MEVLGDMDRGMKRSSVTVVLQSSRYRYIIACRPTASVYQSLLLFAQHGICLPFPVEKRTTPSFDLSAFLNPRPFSSLSSDYYLGVVPWRLNHSDKYYFRFKSH